MKLSIITPSFNQAAFLPRTLESIAAQTHQEIEHIVQDPGSTDGTLEILRRYAATHPNASVHVEKDEGQADAINRGFRRATGEILCWLNTDDYYESPEVLADVIAVFRENPEVDVVYGRGDFVDASGATLRSAFIHTDPENLVHHLMRSVGILQPGLFFRARLIRRAGLLDTSMSCAFDHDLWARFAAAGARFHFIDRKLVNATFHQDAKSSKLRRTQLQESADVSQRYYSFASAEWVGRTTEFDLTGRNEIVAQKDTPEFSPAQRELANKIIETRFRLANSSNDARYAIISAPHLKQYSQSRKLAESSGLVEVNRVIATTFDDAYLEQGLTLIASIRKQEGTQIPIVVYDLNLSRESKQKLTALTNVHMAGYPADAVNSFPGFLYPKNYSYKCVAMRDAARYVGDDGLVLWIDAGVAPIASLEPIYEILRETGVFFVDHDDKASWPFYNGSFCHPRAAAALSASTAELFGEHLCSCLVGYRKGGPFQQLFEEADRYARIEEAVIWSKHPALSTTMDDTVPPRKPQIRLSQELAARPQVLRTIPPAQAASVLGYFGHRQDQTILSILAARYNAPIQSATRFCRSDDASSKVSKLNWASQSAWNQVETSSEVPSHIEGTVTYHHRGTYHAAIFQTDRAASPEVFVLSPECRLLLDTRETLADGLANRIREREAYGIELFVLRDAAIDSLPDDAKTLSCVWSFDRLREIVPELFTSSAEPEAIAASVKTLLAISQPPQESLPLDEDLRAIRFSLPAQTGGILEKLLPSEAGTLLEVGTSSVDELSGGKWKIVTCQPSQSGAIDLARICWKQGLESVDLLRVEVPEKEASLLSSFPWDEAKPAVVLCHLAKLGEKDCQRFLSDACGLLTRHGYSAYLVKRPGEIGFRILPPYEAIVRWGEGDSRGRWDILVGFREDPGIQAIRELFQENVRFRETRKVGASLQEIIGTEAGASTAPIDESLILFDLLQSTAGSEKVLISAGVDRELLRHPFLTEDWKVLGLSSDATERSYLAERYAREAAHGQLILESRTASDKIDGQNRAAPLADLMQEYQISSATILHLHTGGHESDVLRGFPWHVCSPAAIVSFGAPNQAVAASLQERGYRIFLSEWAEAPRRGVTPEWKRLWRGSPLPDAVAGATIALRPDISVDRFIELFQTRLQPAEPAPKQAPSVVEEAVVEPTPGAPQATPKAEEKAEEVPAPEKAKESDSQPKEFRAGTRAILQDLLRKNKPLCIGLIAGIIGGAVLIFVFGGAIATAIWIVAALSLCLNLVSIDRQDKAEFGVKSALGDIHLLKEKVVDLRIRTNALKGRSKSLENRAKYLETRATTLEQKAEDVQMHARKLENAAAAAKKDIETLEDRVDVGVKDLNERSTNLQFQSQADKARLEKVASYMHALRALPNTIPDPSQRRSRVISELGFHFLETWAGRLEIEANRESLTYLAKRISELEGRSIGRLDMDIEAIVLQVLIAKSLRGNSLHALEVGGMFGLGLAALFECCLGDFESIRVVSAEPLRGHAFPDRRDPQTGQIVNSRVIERNLTSAGASAEELTICEALAGISIPASQDLVIVHGNPAELLPKLESIVRPGGYLLLIEGGELSKPAGFELLGNVFGLEILKKKQP